MHTHLSFGPRFGCNNTIKLSLGLEMHMGVNEYFKSDIPAKSPSCDLLALIYLPTVLDHSSYSRRGLFFVIPVPLEMSILA